MRLTTLAQILIALILLLAFWKPLMALWQAVDSRGFLGPITAIDVMVFIALGLLAMRVMYAHRSSSPNRSSRTERRCADDF